MNIFYFTVTLSIFLYGLFFETVFIKIYGGFLALYFLGVLLPPNSKYHTLRRKLMIPCWKEAEEGNILARFELDCTNFLKLAEKFPKEKKITLTHLVCKIAADILKEAPDVNGRIAFGKYVPYDEVRVSCLCDIDGGKDLANINLENADQLSIEEIQEIIRSKAIKIKSKNDQEHKNLTEPFKLIPSLFFIERLFFFYKYLNSMIHFILSLTYFFGVTCLKKPVKKFCFPPALITNVGMMEVQDCYAPNNLVSKAIFLFSINKMIERPVAIDKKIEIRPMIYLGATIDHRFLDGGRCKIFTKLIYDGFEHPEKYLAENMKAAGVKRE